MIRQLVFIALALCAVSQALPAGDGASGREDGGETTTRGYHQFSKEEKRAFYVFVDGIFKGYQEAARNKVGAPQRDEVFAQAKQVAESIAYD